MKTAIIIGGGLGGLFTGAILAKEGCQVTVLEKNATVGGGLQSFRRFGETFDTGMHVIGGMQPGGNIRRICEYLGIANQMKIMDVDDACSDSIFFAEDQMQYRIRKGRKGFVESLAAYFPEERDDLERYLDAVYAITDSLDLYNLRPASDSIAMHDEDFLMSADAFIAKYIKNDKLRSVVAYMNPLYGGKGDETPSFIHAVITTLYVNGASRFVGGSCQFAQLLVDLILRYGGKVLTKDGVEWVEVKDRHVEYVQTRKGERYEADYYIAAIHPCTLLKLMPEHAFPKAYRNRLNEIPNSYSAFSLYVKLKPRTLKFVNHSEYYMTRYADIWKFGEPMVQQTAIGEPHDSGHTENVWPLGFLFMTAPDENQGEYANKVLVTAPMLFEAVKKWEDTEVGHRGADYLAWKASMVERLLDCAEKLHPGFRDCVDQIESSSPLTIRDYYGVKEGAMCGYSKDYKNMALSQVPVVTKVDNLLLTGQCNNLHGFSGVPLTAINTAEVILGKNYVMNHINDMEMNHIK